MTAGLDSRVSYYAVKDYKDKIFFFTEDRDDDFEKSQVMARREGLNWMGADSKDLHFDDNKLQAAFKDCMTETVYPFNARFALRNNFFNFLMFGGKKFTQIHSNCAEAARGRAVAVSVEYDFWPEKYKFDKFLESYINSTCWFQSDAVKEYQKKIMPRDSILVQEEKSFFDFVNHDSLRVFGYNPWDIMYIEQRVAGFLSQQHMLNDAAFESISLTNCRYVLDIMWQVPNRYINFSSLLYNCILNELDERERQINMGKNFKAKPEDVQGENYALIYGGYIMLEQIESSEERYELLKKALAKNPTVKWAYERIVDVARKLGQYEEAFYYAEQMLDYDSSMAGHWSLDALCNVLRKEEKWKEKTAELLKKILSKNENIAWANRQLGQILFSADQRQGLAFCEKAYRLEPKNWVVASVYANLLKESNHQMELAVLLDGDMKMFSDMDWYKKCRA